MAAVKSTTRRQLELAVVMIAAVALVGAAATWLIPRDGVSQAESLLRNGQAVLLFAAASLGLLSGRWAARTSAGFAGATLVVLAFAGITSATSLSEDGFGPVFYTACAAFAIVMLLGAAAAPEANDLASIRQLLNRDGGPVALLTLAALTPVVEAVLVAGMTMPLPARLVLSGLFSAGWLTASHQVRRLHRPRLGWLPAVLMILAVAAMARAFVGVWPGLLLVALGLEALAGAFALVGAVTEVRAALVGTTDGMTSMLQDLSAMRDEDSRRRAEESERLHEVRSVLAGLYAARATLSKYEGNLDPEARRRLQDAVGEELSRLNQLIDPAASEVTRELDLEAVLTSVVVAEREQGLVVTTDLADLCVRGRAGEIATLVSDLLVNARVHAPGSPVRLTARVDAGMVALEVRNWGPRLSATDRERVFERAYRGSQTVASGVPGSGLGLYTARRLARQMHGDLQLRTLAGRGCCFVVTLPVGSDSVTQAGRDPAPPQIDQEPAPTC
jgi:signal transduction histidine kinase